MEKNNSTVNDLRSSHWYAADDRYAHIHRAWTRRGLPVDALDATKPQIAIANTASDLTPCNVHLNAVAESVKAGGWAAGVVHLLAIAGRLGSMDDSDERLQARSQSPASEATYAIYVDHVLQADQGTDLDLLVGSSGDKVNRESH